MNRSYDKKNEEEPQKNAKLQDELDLYVNHVKGYPFITLEMALRALNNEDKNNEKANRTNIK